MTSIQFSFWNEVSLNCALAPDDYIDPESVLIRNQLVITGTNASGETSDTAMFDLTTGACTVLPVQGLHPVTDGQDTLYLLTIIDPDFRYRVIEVCVSTYFASTLDTTGIAPKKRSGRFTVVYHQGCLFMLGGFQIFRGDATGSFVYQLILDTKEWTTLEYSGRFPASVPHAPMTGCRAGHSASLYNSKLLIFGGTTVEDSMLNTDYLTSSLFDNTNTNDLYELDLAEARWQKLTYKTQNCMVPAMANHVSVVAGDSMIVFCEGKLYRLDLKTMTWTRIRKSLKAPNYRGMVTLQVHQNYLYLFCRSERLGLYRLNLRKLSIVEGGDCEDFSAFFDHERSSDVAIKVFDKRISAHKKVLQRYSGFLSSRLNSSIKTISISEFSYASVHGLIHMIYHDCTPELPRDLASYIDLLKVSYWLDITEVVKKCVDGLTVSAANLRVIVQEVCHIPEVFQRTVAWVKLHLKEAATILKPEQLVSLLSA